MVSVRTGHLPPDLQYVLDGMAEDGHITSAADIAIRLYGHADTLDELLGDPTIGWSRPGLHRLGSKVEAYGADLILQTDERFRAAFAYLGVHSVVRKIGHDADWLVSWYFEDQIKGGCNWRYRKRERLNGFGKISGKTARRLYADGSIRRYIGGMPEIMSTRGLWHSVKRVLSSLPAWPVVDDADINALFAALNGQHDEAMRERRREMANRAFADGLRARGEDATWVDGFFPKEPDAEARKVVTRASRIASAIVGPAAVSAFVKGERVRLGGEKVIVEARRKGSVFASGHGSVEITLLDPGDERHLANLCLYQEAPALDQLASLALHVQARAELDLLEKGNLYAVHPNAYENQAIAERKPKKVDAGWQAVEIAGPEAEAIARAMNGRHTRWHRPQFEAMKEEYAKAMFGTFRRHVGEFVCGRAVKKVPLHLALPYGAAA